MSDSSYSRARKQIIFALKLAAAMIAAALLLTLARKQGWIEGAQVVRAQNVVIGLALAAFCNSMPKMLGRPPRSTREATLSQAVLRVGGWVMTVGLLVWTALWAFAPQRLASIGSVIAVGASVAIMLGYATWKCITFRAPRSD
ncbi:hypothetical protein DVT68_00655 [Dyella solisilvae]|uniref:Ammonium transporter n=1 Tax=Dyella solisilvae TaxID=1920168 RepID=A0A370K9S8_9GAMM|nr:hypothetical protein [Dyella solisilvae]RDI99408.1 hypothetical protein DVT68_00655 [Dyella solisilvae]